MISENSQTIEKGNDEITLKELLLKIKEFAVFFWTKKWNIIIAALIGGALGYGYSKWKKTSFIATTTFVLENNEGGGGLGAYAGLASMVGIDFGGGGGGGIFQGDNILDLYKSKAMIRRTLFNRIDSNSHRTLIEEYIRMNFLKDRWQDKKELEDLNFIDLDISSKSISADKKRLRDSVIAEVVDDIEKNYLSVAKPDKKLSRIQIDVKSKNEIFSKRFNDELVKNVNEFYIRTKTQKSMQNVLILQHKTDSVRAVMNGEIYRAVEVVDATPNLNPTRQVQRAAPAQKAQFSAETNKAILAELVKNLEMSKITLLRETPLIQVVDQPIYPLKKEKIGSIKGILTGGFILSFLVIIWLFFKLVLKNILGE